MRAARGHFRAGTSGWQYDHWSGPFYPEDLPKEKWFGFYARHFDTVEVNNTFYHLPKAATFDKWREQAPEGFTYVLKYSRYGTHLKHLADPAGHVAKFLDRAERLGGLLGPILVQLPPRWNADPVRLAAFLAAAAGKHRWALEFRDASWLCPEVYEILRRRNAALCIHDQIENHPVEITADWIYLRFHGAANGGDYSHEALSAWAQRIEDWLADGLDVFAYFNNDAKGRAVNNARDLKRYIEG